jgi:hypothetical protein
VYDMYPWDSASQGDYPPEPLRSRRSPKTRETPARAVQIALDRRDNGGDAVPAGQSAVPPGQSAVPPGRSATPSGRSATPSAARLTRQ